jgi:hypothetical protein
MLRGLKPNLIRAILLAFGFFVSGAAVVAASWNGTVGPEFGEEMAIIQLILCVPCAALAVWLAAAAFVRRWIIVAELPLLLLAAIAGAFVQGMFGLGLNLLGVHGPAWPAGDRTKIVAYGLFACIGPTAGAVAEFSRWARRHATDLWFGEPR